MRRVEDATARDRRENSAVARIRLGGQTGRQLDGDEAMCGFAIRGNRSRGNRSRGNRSRGNRSRGNRAGGWPSDVGSRSGIKRF
jgi:hypothetical protein